MEYLNELWPVRAKWYNLGLGLRLSSDELDAISKSFDKPDDCLREALKHWLSNKPDKNDLITALRQPCVGYHQLLASKLDSPRPAVAVHGQGDFPCYDTENCDSDHQAIQNINEVEDTQSSVESTAHGYNHETEQPNSVKASAEIPCN